jgi:hypothetical protein
VKVLVNSVLVDVESAKNHLSGNACGHLALTRVNTWGKGIRFARF